MKNAVALLIVGGMLTLAACQQKPKTEEVSVDSTTTMSADTVSITADSLDTGAGMSSEGVSTTSPVESLTK